MPVSVRIACVRGEINRRRYRLEFHLDAGFLAGLLHDGLCFLAWGVNRRLKDEFQLLSILSANAVRATLPAGLLQYLVRLLDIEFPLRVLRYKARRVVDEISGRDACASVDMLLYRSAIDEQLHRLTNDRIAEQRVFRLDARALAVDLGPRIRAVELDMLD